MNVLKIGWCGNSLDIRNMGVSKWCGNSLDIRNMGVSSLQSHASYKKHKLKEIDNKNSGSSAVFF